MTTTTSAAPDSTTMSAQTALALTDLFAPSGFHPDWYVEITFYQCRTCGRSGPVGRALFDGDFRGLSATEQAAHTWSADHADATGHEYSDRMPLSRVPARTSTIRRLSKATRTVSRS
ncbi:hypothetical protein [Streptomyces collinus]|uniref:hypothetical protein n=1 Tax=Streptomyces collinus TaxID=42684 RepID=UPI0033EF85D5